MTAWLKAHPFVRVVSRDGFTGFRQGIKQANSSILHVYDRWHFIQNAKKQLDLFLATFIPSIITWTLVNPDELESAHFQTEPTLTNPQLQKWRLIQEIQQKHQEGMKIARLAREYDLNWRTVQKYTKMSGPPSFKRSRKKATDGYESTIRLFEKQGNTVKEIQELLQKDGYKGTFSSVRTAIEAIRKKRYQDFPPESIAKYSRKKLSACIWKLRAQLASEDQDFLEHCFRLYPAAKSLYLVVQEYRSALENRDYDAFLSWLKEQLAEKKNPFYQYARRLRSDLQAIKNAFLLPYNNGLLEGHVNRLKTIKRMTYGRAGLKLLEKRILYHL